MLRRILYVLQVLRLTVLMLAGASIGSLMGTGVCHSPYELVERQFHSTIFGALCGLAVELVVRQAFPIPEHDIPPLRFSLRTLLIVFTYAAILFGLIAYLVRR